jgi:nucleotide-binding universal stress UspA family protein
MNSRMKVLIGYDGSENSDYAIEQLKHAGLPDSVDAVVLSVADVFIAPPVTDSEEMFPPTVPHSVQLGREHAERKLKDARLMAMYASERLGNAFPTWNVSHIGMADSPAWAIIQKAEEMDADLVVVGALGHSVLGGRLILGSVSQRVLYESNSSVRIARSTVKKEPGPLKLVVGVDNSIFSHAVVEMISSRNWPAETQVRLVAVVDTVLPVVADPNEPSVMKWIEVGDADKWDEIRKIFQPSADKLIAKGLDAAVMIIRGNPKDALVEEAETWGADCIFVGSKGIRGVERLLLGSVASAVSARAHCSVEVVRPGRKLKSPS